MIVEIDNYTSEERAMINAWLHWKLRGHKNAWASVVAEARKMYGWTPITPENLPKVGDEMYAYSEIDGKGYVTAVEPEHAAMSFEVLTKGGDHTFFRPINAPQSGPAGDGQ